MVYNTTQHHLPTPRPHTVCMYTLYVYFGKGGRVGEVRDNREATVHKKGRKYQYDWLYLQSINSIKH